MEKKERYTLGKTERLKSRKAIEQLFKEGRSFAVFPLRVLYILKKNELLSTGKRLYPTIPRLQAGFTVGGNNFKKAVDRNRVKRLIREVYRLQKNKLEILNGLNENALQLFFIYVGKELPEYKLLYEKMAIVLERLIKLTVENR